MLLGLPYEVPENYDPNGRFGGDGFIGDIFEGIGNVASDIKTGLTNAWYKLTGQEEKTSSYQAKIARENELLDRQEGREDSAYQRAVKDMMSAGLSKYGATPASSGSYRTGVDAKSDPIASLSAIQNLQDHALAIDEEKHNLAISKNLGIRTGDTNYAAKWAELGNVLFGFDPTTVDGGVIPYVFRLLFPNYGSSGGSSAVGSSSGSSSSEGSSSEGSPSNPISDWDNFSQYVDATQLKYSDLSPILNGASIDQTKEVLKQVKKLQGLDDQQKSEIMSDLVKSVTPSLPKSLTDQVNKGLDKDLPYLVSQMKSKGFTDNQTIERIADFLSVRYDKSKDSIIKRIKELL